MATVRTLNVTKRLKGVLQSVVIDVVAMNLAVLAFRSLSTAPIRNMIPTTAVVLDGISMVRIEVSGVTDKDRFCKLLSQEFGVPVYFKSEINERRKKSFDLYKFIAEDMFQRIHGDYFKENIW